MIQKKLKFSIITITYNSEKTLEQTIKSVINQKYDGPIEYIIIDGQSTDNTINVIKKYQNKISKFISEKDNGISDALNKGIKLATGDIIGIIHSDDWYELDAFEKINDVFISNNVDIVCGKVRFFNNDNFDLIYESNPNLLEYEMTVQHPSVFIKKTIYDNEGLFDVNLKYAMEYDLLLRFKLKNYKFFALNDIIANMRYDGASDKNWLKALVEVKNIKIKYGISKHKALIYFIKQVIRKLIAKFLLSIGLNSIVKFYRKYLSIVKKTNN